MINFGICFSKEFEGNAPLAHIIGFKLPVYLRLLEFCQNEGWNVYVLTRKTYKGNGIFNGAWLFKDGEFKKEDKTLKMDLVYDRTGGVTFPPEKDNLRVVNRRDFKVMCWNKWLAYKEIGEYMPKTFWVGDEKNLAKVLPKIKADWVALKPYDGQQGIGVFVGSKAEALKFEFSEKYPTYILQEFVDTSHGIDGLTDGLHDLRIVLANRKVIWSHIRIPPEGSFKANVAEGGKLMEIDYKKVPGSVKKVVESVSKIFFEKYDNPSYSLDFGIDKDGTPKIFEINDQIGFPRWEANGRDKFLKELVKNFASKISTHA